jgi:hypothetical protein
MGDFIVANEAPAELSHFLLIYRHRERFGAIVVKASSLPHALIQAENAGLNGPNAFRLGQELDARFVSLIHPTQVGRILSATEARELLATFEMRYGAPPHSRYLRAAE